MVIGNGSLASIFYEEFNSDKDVLIFASGVSNSTEENEDNFKREENLLINCVAKNKEKKIIYFSSVFVGFVNNKYYNHKLNMEKIILKNCENFLIIRLPQVISKKGNFKNVINFFKDSVKNNQKIKLYNDSWRSIIDIDDVYQVTKKLIVSCKNQVILFSNVEILKVVELYRKIVSLLNGKENYELIESFEKIPIINNSSEVDTILYNMNISSYNYTDKILNKYIK